MHVSLCRPSSSSLAFRCRTTNFRTTDAASSEVTLRSARGYEIVAPKNQGCTVLQNSEMEETRESGVALYSIYRLDNAFDH